jgi:hypothetical protein
MGVSFISDFPKLLIYIFVSPQGSGMAACIVGVGFSDFYQGLAMSGVL